MDDKDAEIARLQEEREFLLARSGKAGSASFNEKRWTGMSSNALVEVAFGGKNDWLPSDGGDLSACYLTILRMPQHLRTAAVFDQLEAGERHVGRYPDTVEWAQKNAEWPDNARVILAASPDQSA